MVIYIDELIFYLCLCYLCISYKLFQQDIPINKGSGIFGSIDIKLSIMLDILFLVSLV